MANAPAPEKNAKNASAKAAQDPRFRPFRIGAYAFYLVVVSVLSLQIIRGVVGSVVRMTPPRRPPAEVTLTVPECLERAEALLREMEQERARLFTASPATDTDDNWGKFRIGWEERYRDAESRCALDSRARPRLREVFDRLSRVMDLFTTAAIQYAGEAGGPVDELRASMDAARREPGPSR